MDRSEYQTWLRSVLCVLVLPSLGLYAETQTFQRGAAEFSVTAVGGLNLSVDGAPWLQNSYVNLGLPNSSASLWSVGEVQESLTVSETAEGAVRVRAAREIAGVVQQEVEAVFAATMLVARWRLRFGDLPQERAGGYREVGFLLPYQSIDNWLLQAETPYDAEPMSGRVRAEDENPALGRVRWLRLRHGGQSMRLEPVGLTIQNRADDYRFVSGGRIAAGQELEFVVYYDWSGALDETDYDRTTGAKRPLNLRHLIDDGWALDVCAERRHFFHPGAPARMALRTLATDGAAGTIPIRFRVEDYWDQVIHTGVLDVPVSAGATTVQTIDAPTDRTGMFRFVVEYPGTDGQVRTAQALYGVVPERGLVPANWDSPFGMHLHATAHHLLLGEQIGVAWNRAHDTMAYTQWRTAEPAPGQWRWYDQRYDQAAAHGMNILGVLNSPPSWAVEQAAGRHLLEWTDEDLEMWRTYCKQVMTHYQDRIRYWEVLNEPYGAILNERNAAVRARRAEGYVRLLRIAYETAQAIDPDLKIVGVCGPPGYYSMEWYPLTFQAGALAYMDILSAHMYPTFFRWPPPDADDFDKEQALRGWYERVRGYLAEHGRADMPIWNTEAGTHNAQTFYTDFTPSYQNRGPIPLERVTTFRETAAFAVRMTIIDLAHDVKHFHYTGHGGAWYLHSIAEGDQTPMPAMIAWAVMTYMLDGAVYAGAVDLGPAAQGHVFEVPGGAVAVVWGTGRLPEAWAAEHHWLPLPSSAVATPADLAALAAGETMSAHIGLLRAYDVMGVEIFLQDSAGTTGLLLSEQPVWLDSRGGNAGELMRLLARRDG